MNTVSSNKAGVWQGPSIRRATVAEAEALAAIGAATFTETFGHLYKPQDLAAFLAEAHGLQRARADLSKPDKAAWLAQDAGEVVGYALAGSCDLPHPEVRPGDGELKRLYLLRRAQRGGLGGQLFAAALAWLLEEGPRAIWIGVWSENLGAQRFYARHGFTKAGEYDFPVGETLDREFILARPAEYECAGSEVRPRSGHASERTSDPKSILET